MTNPTKTDVQVLKKYAKYIVHLRQAYRNDHLTLSFGTNFASSIGIPNWDGLLNRIAARPEVRDKEEDRSKGMAPEVRKDLLHRQFVEQQTDKSTDQEHSSTSPELESEWLELLRSCLYSSIPDVRRLDEKHPYFATWRSLAIETSPVISFGIDSSLQMMLADYASGEDEKRYWETVYNESIPFPNRDCVIYHPDGYLPKNPLDGFSDTIAFPSESNTEEQNTVTENFFFNKQTVLSLEPELEGSSNLHQYLHRTAATNPAQVHYAVELVDQSSEYDDSEIFNYYDRYNILLMKLSSTEVRSLARLIQYDNDVFKQAAERGNIRTKWIYYITGTPGVGKTTAVSYFNNLETYPEWFEEPPEILKLPFTELTPEEEEEVDRWIARQYVQRNSYLAAESEGIFVVDRAPLDPVVFAAWDETAEKAEWYREKLQNYTTVDKLTDGEVFILQGDPEEIAQRLAKRQNAADDPSYLEMMNKRVEYIYDTPGVNKVSSGQTVKEVVEEISDSIFRQTYRPAKLNSKLSRLEQTEVKD